MTQALKKRIIFYECTARETITMITCGNQILNQKCNLVQFVTSSMVSYNAGTWWRYQGEGEGIRRRSVGGQPQYAAHINSRLELLCGNEYTNICT